MENTPTDYMYYFLWFGIGFSLGFISVLTIGLIASKKDRQAERLREKAARETENNNVKIVFKQDGKKM